MPAAGFTMPGVLFLGSVDAQIRGYLMQVLPGLRKAGYTTVVEPCAGAMAISVVARAAGFPASALQGSDVSYFSAVVGAAIVDRPVENLGTTIDGVTPTIPGATNIDRAAWLLWQQMVLRMEAKGAIPYWQELVLEAYDAQDEHRQQIAKSLHALHTRLGGMTYEPLDLFAHIDRVADDPHAIVVASPPTYNAGYEKFFDTGGRLAWDEPEYGVFDPATGQRALYERYADARCLTIFYEEAEPRRHVCPLPVFGQPMGQIKNNYLGSNRPDELLALTNGRPVVAPKAGTTLEPSDYPVMPHDHEPSPTSPIAVLPVNAHVADYYRNVWLHRLVANPGDMNLLLVVDGYAAGVIGYSAKMMAGFRTTGGAYENYDLLLLRFAAGAPHDYLRLTRLASMVALQKHVAQRAAGPKGQLFVAASNGIMTVEFTRHPEAKGQRGLMKMHSREKGKDGFRLVYTAPWQDKPLPTVLGEFLTKEAAWRKATTR